MKHSSLSFSALAALCCVFGACTVQTGTTPAAPEMDSGDTVLSSDSAMNFPIAPAPGNGSGSVEDEHIADPAPTTTDSLEAPTGVAPAAITGHLLISTIGFGNTPESGGPPRLMTFFDYDCEYCRQHALDERRWIDQKYVATGKLAIERVFVAMTPEGKRMDQAALCAGVQNVFPAMDTFLLNEVPQTENAIFAFVKTLKIDQVQFKTCMQNMAVAEGSYTFDDGTVIDRIPAFRIGKSKPWTGIVPQNELTKLIDEGIRAAR